MYGQESVWWYTQCTVKHFLKTKVIWKWIQKAPERHKMCKKKDTKHPWPVWDLGMVQCGADLWFICHQSKSFTINTSLGFPVDPGPIIINPRFEFSYKSAHLLCLLGEQWAIQISTKMIYMLSQTWCHTTSNSQQFRFGKYGLQGTFYCPKYCKLIIALKFKWEKKQVCSKKYFCLSESELKWKLFTCVRLFISKKAVSDFYTVKII